MVRSDVRLDYKVEVNLDSTKQGIVYDKGNEPYVRERNRRIVNDEQSVYKRDTSKESRESMGVPGGLK